MKEIPITRHNIPQPRPMTLTLTSSHINFARIEFAESHLLGKVSSCMSPGQLVESYITTHSNKPIASVMTFDLDLQLHNIARKAFFESNLIKVQSYISHYTYITHQATWIMVFILTC